MNDEDFTERERRMYRRNPHQRPAPLEKIDPVEKIEPIRKEEKVSSLHILKDSLGLPYWATESEVIAALNKRRVVKERAATPFEKSVLANAGAMAAFEGQADRLRKARPELTEAQAFAKVYEDPANRDLRFIERQSHYGKIAYADPTAGTAAMSRAIEAATPGPAAVASITPDITYGDELDTGYDQLSRLAEEIRRSQPFLSSAQAFERATKARPDLMKKDRNERYKRMGFPAAEALRAHNAVAMG